jgi:hypothetical protein
MMELFMARLDIDTRPSGTKPVKPKVRARRGRDDSDDSHDSDEDSDSESDEDSRAAAKAKAQRRKRVARKGAAQDKDRNTRLQTVKEYDGPKIAPTTTHAGFAVVLTEVNNYRSVHGVKLSIAEVMTDVCKDNVCAQLQSVRVAKGNWKEYTRFELESESDGILLQALLEKIKPATAQQWQSIMGKVKMKMPLSTLMVSFSQHTQTAMMEYVADFNAIWGLLRFSAGAYDRGEMHGAGRHRSEFEPTPSRPVTEAPKSGKSNGYGQTSQKKLLSLISIFLDGMPGTFGADMYTTFGFNSHVENGAAAQLNTKKMEWRQVSAAWRTSIMDTAKTCKDISPLARALGTLNRVGADSTKYQERDGRDRRGDSGKPSYNGVRSYKQPDKPVVAEVSMCQDNEQVYAVGDPPTGFCLALAQDRDCRDGPDCPYGHSELQYKEWMKGHGEHFRPRHGFRPSPERYKRLVPNNSFKPKAPVYGQVRVVPRPQEVVNAIRESSDTESEEERQVNRSLQRVTEGEDSDYSDSHC